MIPLRNHPRIEMVPRKSLKPNPNSARRHSDEHIAHIAGSIAHFGFLVPLIVDDHGFIVAGMGRWLAAGVNGLEDVPIIRTRFMSEADRRAFALAENRLGDLSEWDPELLAGELEFLFDQNYDLGIIGFSVADLDFRIVDQAPAENELVELPDPDKPPVSRLDDLWQIGPHRLLCGNSRDPQSYERVLGGELAAMVFSDPPYNVSITRHASGMGRARHGEFAEASGEMTQPEFTAFLRAIFRNCARFSAAGSIHYQCMDNRHIREMFDASDGVYSEFKQLVVWDKLSAGMGTFYRSQYELIFVFKSGSGKHTNNFGLGETGRFRTNLWKYRGANGFYKGRDEDLAAHPTCKSQAMVIDAILDCSSRGDLILDPFSGSGTTLISAHRAKRRGAAIEIDPTYVDTTLRRLQKASGLTAFLSDGRSFENVASARLNGEPNDE